MFTYAKPSSLRFIIWFIFFFFNDTATTEIYTLSLHDALPISGIAVCWRAGWWNAGCGSRSEEHTSELQSHSDLVCRLLLEKKKIVVQTRETMHVDATPV